MKRLQLRVMDLTNPKKLTNTEIKNILGGSGGNVICTYQIDDGSQQYNLTFGCEGTVEDCQAYANLNCDLWAFHNCGGVHCE